MQITKGIMSINKEILIERERIKAIIQRKVEGMIIMRGREKIRKKSKKLIPVFRIKELIENINFLIDNPDYIRLKDR